MTAPTTGGDSRLSDGLAALTALVSIPAEEAGDQLVETLEVIVGIVPGARWATLGERKRRIRPQTIASTGEPGWLADAVQYHLGEGPTLQAMDRRQPVVVSDAARDPRWPRFAASVTTQLRVRSVLSVPLRGVRGKDASLSLYGDASDAFDGAAVEVLPIAVASADITLAGLRQRQRAQNLTRALVSNRRIGVSVGILMAQHHWTEEEAFDALGEVSQALNRKVADLAEEVCLTGTLPTPPPGGTPSEPRPAREGDRSRRPSPRAGTRKAAGGGPTAGGGIERGVPLPRPQPGAGSAAGATPRHPPEDA